MLGKEELIAFEKSVEELWQAGKINAPVHFCGGNEEQLIEIFKEIRPNDYVFSSHRNHYHALLHGVSGDSLLQEILGNDAGAPCRSRARSMGFIQFYKKFFSSAIVGGCCAIAVGVAWAIKNNKTGSTNLIPDYEDKRHVWCFIGDGAVDGGHFWEALIYAETWDLPVTFIVEDNDRATCTSVIQRYGRSRNCIETGSGKRLRIYQYRPTYPHVGTGKYVQF